MRMVLNLIITGVAIYAVMVALIFFAQSRLVYYPDSGRSVSGTPSDHGIGYESVKILTGDREVLHGWFVPASAGAATVIFFPGNAGNISHRIEYIRMFHRLGYNTFIFDYRGYGRSSGTPSEAGTYLDAQAAWQYVTQKTGTPPERIVLFGESLGGAVAAWLAAHEKPASLILVSTFTSIPDLAENLYPFLPVRALSRFEYGTVNMLRGVHCPVFIAHSIEDEIVPFAHGRALYRAVSRKEGGQTQFLELQGGHNSAYIYMRDEWIEFLNRFISTHLGE